MIKFWRQWTLSNSESDDEFWPKAAWMWMDDCIEMKQDRGRKFHEAFAVR
jgi:hypothetical protein